MARSPLRWRGGKYQLAKTLCQLMPPHRFYCEVFGGAGHTLFRKKPAQMEILNDIDGELANFWKTLAEYPESLLRRAAFAVYSRATFEGLVAMSGEEIAALGPEGRAWRFFYLNRTAFAGRDATYATSGRKPAFGFNPRPYLVGFWREHLLNAHERLNNVIIENLHWRQCIERYDSPDMLFYLDPPFYGFEDDYGKGVFGRGDFSGLARALASIRGKFILSVNDTPQTREIFSGFALLSEPAVTYAINRQGPARKGELVYAGPGESLAACETKGAFQ